MARTLAFFLVSSLTHQHPVEIGRRLGRLGGLRRPSDRNCGRSRLAIWIVRGLDPRACLTLRSSLGRSTRLPTAISTWYGAPYGSPTGWFSPSGCTPARRRCFRRRSASRCFKRFAGPLGRGAGCEIVCTTFGDLVVSAAQRAGATILIRGVRDAADFDYEMQMAGMNAAMAPASSSLYYPLRQRYARSPPPWCAR